MGCTRSGHCQSKLLSRGKRKGTERGLKDLSNQCEPASSRPTGCRKTEIPFGSQPTLPSLSSYTNNKALSAGVELPRPSQAASEASAREFLDVDDPLSSLIVRRVIRNTPTRLVRRLLARGGGGVERDNQQRGGKAKRDEKVHHSP